MLGKIKAIEEIYGVILRNTGKIDGMKGSRLGMLQILHAMKGRGEYDGYKITTDKHELCILIDNRQNCFEQWGYFSSEDDFERFIGKEIKEVNLTDVALNKEKAENTAPFGYGAGGIQFVDLVITDGTILQFAVYNDHNGYYGHGIIFLKDEDILFEDTL